MIRISLLLLSVTISPESEIANMARFVVILPSLSPLVISLCDAIVPLPLLSLSSRYPSSVIILYFGELGLIAATAVGYCSVVVVIVLSRAASCFVCRQFARFPLANSSLSELLLLGFCRALW